MAKINFNFEESPTVQAIFAHYERNVDKRPRTSIGASEIGKPCDRALWYSFRHCGQPTFDGRMRRLFETGVLEEPRLIANLRAIGCEVQDKDNKTGKQFEFRALGGHVKGFMDACALGLPEAPKTWHVIDFKTASNKQFQIIRKKGIREAKPEYYAQVMIYMHLSGMKRSMMIVKNKDNDALYAERFKYDKEEAKRILDRAKFIIECNTPPERISDDPDQFVCKFCTFRNLCHNLDEGPPVPVTVSCRNCVHSTPEMDGNQHWVCAFHKKDLSTADQVKACEDHLMIPDLIGFSKVEETSTEENWISYVDQRDGFKWINTKKKGKDYHITSKQLTHEEIKKPTHEEKR